MRFDIAVIGGGPGGTAAAEAAARRGRNVVLFERDLLGGTCLNRGCVPTKALIHSAEAYALLREGAVAGIEAADVHHDLAAMHARKEQVFTAPREGLAKQMKARKVTVVEGEAKLAGPGTVTCNGETYEVDDIIIATGSAPRVPPIPGADLPGVITSDDILEGEAIDYESLVIIGGGVIGMECAGIYNALGCKVTVVEMCDRILPLMDREVSQRLARACKRRGVDIQTKARVCGIEAGGGVLCVSYTDKKGVDQVVEAQGVLIATGRGAMTEGLLADDGMLGVERGAVVTDEQGLTDMPHVWAIGDVRAGTVQLAHVAAAQGRNVVAAICGEPAPLDESCIPSCVYTTPEIATVGLSEDEAKAQGIAVRCAKQLTGANAKSLIEGAEGGYVKLVAAEDDLRILGAQLVCPRATDIISELAVAVSRGMTAGELAGVIHPHPTVSEMVFDAAEMLLP